MNYFVFDIETGRNGNYLDFMPEFKPAANLKNPDLIDKDLDKKQCEWIDKCALSAVTGKILCIGRYLSNYGHYDIFDLPEKHVIQNFWIEWAELQAKDTIFVGHNIFNFDLPYLIQRSWVNGIEPPNLFNKRYWNDNIKDTMDLWNCNRYPKEYISLNNLAKVLNVGNKTDDGKHFQELWENDRPKAFEYIKNDLELVAKIYEIIS